MLVNGNSKTIPLADQSVHCAVTSPPYFGLRDYGLPPSEWGGSADCRHVWENEKITTNSPPRDHNGVYGFSESRGTEAQRAGTILSASQGQFCRHCDVWRGSLGLEPTIELYVAHLVKIFREIRRVLRDDGTCWLNLGDKMIAKRLQGIPWRVALALQADRWYLRRDIIWAKDNPMPESVTDRPTLAHEYLFLLTKKPIYFYDREAVKEPSKTPMDNKARCGFGSANGKNNTNERAHTNEVGKRWQKAPSRNLRTVWTIASEPYAGAHYATFPRKLVEPCIKAGTSQKGCCPKCAMPWERVVEREFVPQEDISAGRVAHRGKIYEDENGHKKFEDTPRGSYRTTTTGWRPACDCDDGGPVPAIVLDPFCGSGTVGQVCRELRRHFIGIDLSAEYLAHSALPRAEQKQAAVALKGLPLFEGF